jgi:hypothetical protein
MPTLPPSEGLSSDEDLGAILARIDRELRARRPPDGMLTRIVAIDGLGGSGKSSFALRLSRELGGAVIVQTDDFATWDNPIDWWPDLLEWVLIPISRGAARFERSRWGREADGKLVVVKPTEFLILEGVTASRDAFAPYLTYSIWIETPGRSDFNEASIEMGRPPVNSGRRGWPRKTATAPASGPKNAPTSWSGVTATSGPERRTEGHSRSLAQPTVTPRQTRSS